MLVDFNVNDKDNANESTDHNEEMRSIHSFSVNNSNIIDDNINENSDNELYYESDTLAETSFSPVTGRRIVNIEYLLNQLKAVRHKGFGCSFYDLNLIREKVEGLRSIFTFECTVCKKIEMVFTDLSENRINTNLAAVAGAIAIGIGYSQMTEIFASMNIPNMSNKTYSKYHSKLSVAINTNIYQLMKEAGKEESKLAIESGNVNEDGIPVISVIVDGAWSKRSYRTNYNALSGVACIIGAKTKKILYVDIKNKYCYVCSRSKNPQDHDCYNNWKNNSTAMEAAILQKGSGNLWRRII